MDKKNYNLEIFFESQKKSFVILSKNKISLEEVKSRTIEEFNIPPEYEKDMRFTIILNNRPITLLNDFQILKNFEEISKNNFYLKINFILNNNNFILQMNKANQNAKNKNKKYKMEKMEQFCIISNISNISNVSNNIKIESKYIEEIKKLKDEIDKLKKEKNDKPEFDIRKFDEKYRDLSTKNNDLKQKIFELENENKALKLEKSKTNDGEDDNLISNNTNNNNELSIKEIEKVVNKIIGEHDKNMLKEIIEIKNKIDVIQNEHKTLYDKFNKNSDNNFELLSGDKVLENISIKEEVKNDNLNDDINNEIIDKKFVKEEFNNKINDDKENMIINIKKDEKNCKDLKNISNIINDNNNNFNLNSIKDSLKEENEKEEDISLLKNIRRNINFYNEENEKNSKSFDNSTKVKVTLTQEDKHKFKEIKQNFLDENNDANANNSLFNKIPKSNIEKYSKYKVFYKKSPDKIKIKNKKKIIIYNNTNSNLTQNLSDEDLINYESCTEVNTDLRNSKNKDRVPDNNSLKNINLKKTEKKISNDVNNISNYNLYRTSTTPMGDFITNKKEKNSYKRNIEKYGSYTTPNGKDISIKENIENYFINIYQNIFFYGNNGYVNILNISEKLTKKLKEGICKFRMNINEVKSCCIKYISYSIIPIINDINTKEYQRKILKDKIKKILEYLKIETNYFEKEYKDFKDKKIDKSSERGNINGVNITHAKINEFRKLYELKEKDYPDEMLIKALIRYRGNKEMAFQYLFY